MVVAVTWLGSVGPQGRASVATRMECFCLVLQAGRAVPQGCWCQHALQPIQSNW